MLAKLVLKYGPWLLISLSLHVSIWYLMNSYRKPYDVSRQSIEAIVFAQLLPPSQNLSETSISPPIKPRAKSKTKASPAQTTDPVTDQSPPAQLPSAVDLIIRAYQQAEDIGIEREKSTSKYAKHFRPEIFANAIEAPRKTNEQLEELNPGVIFYETKLSKHYCTGIGAIPTDGVPIPILSFKIFGPCKSKNKPLFSKPPEMAPQQSQETR